MLARCTKLVASIALVLLAAPPRASAETVIRLATTESSTSAWGITLTGIAAKWKTVTNGEVTLKVYAGTQMGDEADIVKKLRIDTVQAAVISTTGMYDIEPSSFVLDLPLLYKSGTERGVLLAKLAPMLEQALKDKGYIVLAWASFGQISLYSTIARPTLGDARAAKLFAPNAPSFVKLLDVALGFRPVALPAKDIIPSLVTGLIDAVFTTPTLALAMNLQANAKYQSNLVWSMLDGAFIVKQEAWERLSAEFRVVLKRIVVDAGKVADAKVAQIEVDAKKRMVAQGLQIVNVADAPEWDAAVALAQPSIRGKVVPAAVYDEAQRILKEYRATTP